MELDTKQKVLIALYTEYQKDLPDMLTIDHNTIGVNADSFNVAIDKLQNEGFIQGAIITKTHDRKYPLAIMNHIKMTRYGIEYVEEKLEIANTMNGKEKTETVIKKLAAGGYSLLTDLAAKILAEMAKQP